MKELLEYINNLNGKCAMCRYKDKYITLYRMLYTQTAVDIPICVSCLSEIHKDKNFKIRISNNETVTVKHYDW